MKREKWLFLLISCLLFTVILAGCGSSVSNSDSVESDTMSDSTSMDTGFTLANVTTTSGQAAGDTEPPSAVSSSSSQMEQKLIYKGDLNIETGNHEETVQQMISSLEHYGGYIVSQEDYDGRANYKSSVFSLRIPSSHFFTWLDGVEQLPGLNVSKHIYTEDVSEEYVDLRAREKAKQVVIDKYIEYMELAETADELIRFTNELAYRQEELESVQARLRYLEHQVNYSSLNVTVRESSSTSFLAELNLGHKLQNSFESGIRGFVGIAGFMLTAIIVLLPLIVLFVIIWAITRTVIKSKGKRTNGQQLNAKQSETQLHVTPIAPSVKQSDAELPTQIEVNDEDSSK